MLRVVRLLVSWLIFFLPAAWGKFFADGSFLIVVDGAAWRTHGANPGSGFKYPDFLLGDEVVTGVKGGKKSKL